MATQVLSGERAPCPACGRSVRLTGERVLARHHNLSATMTQRCGAVCVGSGLVPGARPPVVAQSDESRVRIDTDG